MKNLIGLLSVLQLTKDQPLTGYISSGMKLHEVPTLAEHHYTTVLSSYLLTQKIKAEGGKIDERRVMLMTMFHDLPELFGGDISAPLNRKYPDLREYKNKIGERAIEMIGAYMDKPTREEFLSMQNELEAGQTDEAIVAKILDQMDHQLFLEYHNHKLKYNPGTHDYRPDFLRDHIIGLTKLIKDKKTKKVMLDFLNEFKKSFFGQGFQGMSLLME